MENGLGETIGIVGDCSELRELFLPRGAGSHRSHQRLQVARKAVLAGLKEEEARKGKNFRKEKLGKDHQRGRSG